jgi:hypothetical protein
MYFKIKGQKSSKIARAAVGYYPAGNAVKPTGIMLTGRNTFVLPTTQQMKKVILLAFVSMIALSSCSFETMSHCPTYSHHNKITKHGHKAQSKYSKHKAARRPSLI